MIKFDLAMVCIHAEVIGRNIANLNHLAETGQGAERLPEFGEVGLGTLAHGVRGVVETLVVMGAPHASAVGKDLIRRLESKTIGWNAVAAAEALTLFHEQFLRECREHVWVRIDEQYVESFHNKHPWGEAVSKRFPNVDGDIRAAGIAMGIELFTAAVFHLMRVAEAGLKWLARKLKVSLTDNRKPLPVDEATWNKLIDGINGRIRATRQKVKGPKTRVSLERYASAAAHCDYMKDMWRNNVSHSHRSYNAPEAEAATQRVRDFMQFLAAIP
jgi:hypothetical protein